MLLLILMLIMLMIILVLRKNYHPMLHYGQGKTIITITAIICHFRHGHRYHRHRREKVVPSMTRWRWSHSMHNRTMTESSSETRVSANPTFPACKIKTMPCICTGSKAPPRPCSVNSKRTNPVYKIILKHEHFHTGIILCVSVERSFFARFYRQFSKSKKKFLILYVYMCVS